MFLYYLTLVIIAEIYIIFNRVGGKPPTPHTYGFVYGASLVFTSLQIKPCEHWILSS